MKRLGMLLTAARSKILKKHREVDKCRTSVGCLRSLAALPSMASALLIVSGMPATAAPTDLVLQQPVRITEVNPGVFLVDFERVAFGNIRLISPAAGSEKITVHFGEMLSSGRVQRNPPGTVRYGQAEVRLIAGQSVIAAPPADRRNTEQATSAHPPAVLTPPEWGVVLPFRWVEIEGWPGPLRPEQICRQAAFSATWDDDAASFHCSDDMLNRVWDLCRYSIKATTFAGIYVDGDRERIPYEADAYLNQISHYATDTDIQMARDTFDWLMKNPTWPTEWAPHMVFMAHADWMHTGESQWLAARYESLKTKLLMDRVGADGLVHSSQQQMRRGDIVDWPQGERDGYVFSEINTVVNAFHLRALKLMAEMARGLGRTEEAAEYSAREQQVRAVFQANLFDPERSLYRDGKDVEHSSLHANLFPLAFELVPDEFESHVANWLAHRGMACSVYAAQYLLEGLFESGQGADAIRLITAPTDRSWRHMVESGTTITWEAWDLKYKPNQDWNHAWGAAPANLLPRYVLGVQPLEPGWQKARIRPHLGSLRHAKGRIPTPRGPIDVEWTKSANLRLQVSLPTGMTAAVELPALRSVSSVLVNGQPVAVRRQTDRLILESPIAGHSVLEVPFADD